VPTTVHDREIQMQQAELAIVGGRVVTPDGVIEADLVARDGRVAALAATGTAEAPETIDARGCLVLPGGVDPHAHALTDLAAVSRAAAHGGTTTILTFTLPDPGERPLDAFTRARDACVPRAVVDVGVHGSYFDPRHVPVELLEQLRGEGVCGVQVFLAFPELGLMFDDGQLYRVLRDATALGIPVQVQCENGPLVDALTAELIAAGETGLRAYPRSRPGAVEDEAVARTLAIAALAGAPVYLVHLSTAIAVELARRARAQGADVVVEACTHHLLLDESAYERADAGRFVVGPPLRPAADVDALWEAIRDGTIATVGSDHSQMAAPPAGPGSEFAGAPMGLPGMELRLPLVLSEGLRRGLPLTTLADVLAAGPARAFGLYPRKGALAVGSDADVVVWDPAGTSLIDAASLHDGLGHSPYEGMEIDGAVRASVIGGRVFGRAPTGGRLVSPVRDHVASTSHSRTQPA
jgi:dihydropyrimidinase